MSCIELKLDTNDEEGITQQIRTLCISMLGIFSSYSNSLINSDMMYVNLGLLVLLVGLLTGETYI